MNASLPCSFALAAVFFAGAAAQTPQTPPTPPTPQTPQTPPSPVAPPSPQTIHPQITTPDANPPAPQNPAPESPRTVTVPLLDCSGLPCIEMTTGSGKTVRLAIDLGEANSYLDSKAAQALGVTLQPLQGAGDATVDQVQQTVVPGAKIGDLPMGDFPFMVLDATPQPDPLVPKPQAFPAEGVLTFRAFQNRVLAIDFAHHTVNLSEPQDAAPPCPQECNMLVIEHVGRFGPVTLTTDGFSLQGDRVSAQIDTLFTGTMLVYPAAVEKLGLKKEAKSKRKEFFPYVQGGLKLARFDGVSYAFRGPPFDTQAPVYFFTSDDHPADVQFDVTVGTGLLSQGVFTFDFKGMHMWMGGGSAAPAR